jgi:hypothetical protein
LDTYKCRDVAQSEKLLLNEKIFQASATFTPSDSVSPAKQNIKIMENNLREVLMPIAVLGSFSFGLYIIIKTLTDYYLRKKMVEKGIIGDDAGQLLQKQAENKYGALKWGLIILSGGIGLMLLEMIDYDQSSPLPYGILATCLSIGFLAYFLIVQRLNK